MTNEKQLAKIISFTQEIESILKEKFKVKGRGLHAYLDCIESKIDNDLLGNLRYIATIRNKAMHESLSEIENFLEYEKKAKETILALKDIAKPLTPTITKKQMEILIEENKDKNPLLQHPRYMMVGLFIVLLTMSSKFLSVVIPDMFADKHENILDESGEIQIVIETPSIEDAIALKEINKSI